MTRIPTCARCGHYLMGHDGCKCPVIVRALPALTRVPLTNFLNMVEIGYVQAQCQQETASERGPWCRMTVSTMREGRTVLTRWYRGRPKISTHTYYRR